MSLNTRMQEQKNSAEARESARKQLVKTERDYRATKYVESWSRVPKIGANLSALSESERKNTAIALQQQAAMMSKLNEAQLSTSFSGFTPENMLRLIRLAMPNTARNKVFTEFAMETARDSIKYIRPVYSNTQKGRDLSSDKHTSGKAGAFESKDVSQFNDVNADTWARAIYETTEDRFTSELINLSNNNGVFSPKADESATKKINADSYIPGYTVIFDTTEVKTIATQNKRTGEFFIDASYAGKIAIIDNIKGTSDVYVNNTTGKVVSSSDESTTTTVAAGTLAVINLEADTLTLSDIKAFGRFNLEDDLLGEYLGEIKLEMSDYEFRPRPTTIGVTWSQLSEITLDTSFGVSAQEMLVQYAGDAIRIQLDLRSFKFAYAVAKSNSGYTVTFDAGYAKTSNSTVEGYYHTAQTFPVAVETVTDVMVNDINRGGVSRMVAGASAGSYMTLVKGTYDPKGRQPSKGIYQFGEFGGIPVFKAPSSIIPTNEILCVWKDDQNEGDVAIAFGTLVPFFNTGVIQRQQFYKEAGLASYGDWACLNKRYLGIIKITGLKDTTVQYGDDTNSDGEPDVITYGGMYENSAGTNL